MCAFGRSSDTIIETWILNTLLIPELLHENLKRHFSIFEEWCHPVSQKLQRSCFVSRDVPVRGFASRGTPPFFTQRPLIFQFSVTLTNSRTSLFLLLLLLKTNSRL